MVNQEPEPICEDCPQFNDEYILDFDGPVGEGGECAWSAPPLEAGYCGADTLYLNCIGGQWELVFAYTGSPPGAIVLSWTAPVGPELSDCMGPIVLTLDVGTDCDGIPATVTIYPV
jgi:hypothetical protein